MRPLVDQGLTKRDIVFTVQDMSAKVRAGGLRGYLAVMRSLGCDPAPVMHKHGLDEAQLTDEDGMLPLPAVIRVFEDSAVAAKCPDLALRLAQVQDINILGPIAVAIQNCPTLERALDCISNYLFIQSPGLRLYIDTDRTSGPDEACLHYEVEMSDPQAGRQILQHGLAIAHRMISMLNSRAYELRRVSLSHEPEVEVRTLVQYFGAPVHTSAEFCGLHISRRTLSTPLPAANPVLLKMAADYLDTNFANPNRTLTARLRQLLARRLGSQAMKKEDAAKALAMHPRTLQRHLEAEGTSFNAVRDAVRREAALRYLGGTCLPLAQVASLVGFSEQSALTRFCQQQFLQPPKALRRGAKASQ